MLSPLSTMGRTCRSLSTSPDSRTLPVNVAGSNRASYCSLSLHSQLDPDVFCDAPQSTVGLGTLHCGMERPLSQLRIYPLSESIQPPLHSWADQVATGQSFANNALGNAVEYPTVPSYPPYGNRPAVSQSFFSFPVIPLQGTSDAPAFRSDIHIKSNDRAIYGEVAGHDIITSRSRADTIPMVSVRKEDGSGRSWGIPASHPPMMFNAHAESYVSSVARFPSAAMESGPLHHPLPSENCCDQLLDLDPNMHCTVDPDRDFLGDPSPVGSPSNTGQTPTEFPHFPSPEVGLQCTVCGYRFTRRSNCRQHMKKHDPNRKRDHSCDDCGRLFGRKTDLKRHVNSVSYLPGFD
jgi:Zinc finger, C2H2 type